MPLRWRRRLPWWLPAASTPVVFHTMFLRAERAPMCSCSAKRGLRALAAHAATDDFKHHVGRLETLGTLKIEKFDF